MNINIVKGFRDVMPPGSLRRKAVLNVIEEKMLLFGFIPVETPSIEYEDLLKNDNNQDEAVSDRFRLRDKGDRNLGLRYEFTFQLSRIFNENKTIKLPFRRYQIGSIFRDEPVRPNRYREFIQADADIIGDSSIAADAECVALANSILQALKIKAEIRINNRKLIDNILKNAGITNNNLQVLRELDKLDKLGKDEVKKNLLKIIDNNKVDNLLKLLNYDLLFFKNKNFEGVNELLSLIDYGKAYGYKVKFDPGLIRGFSYYTGNTWEIWSKNFDSALAAGGRYDNKVGKYLGKQIPAVGISFGTILDYPKIKYENIKSLIISINQDKQAIKLAQKLRANKLSTIIFFGKPTKALEYANSCNIQNVLFLGKDEIIKKKIKLKNMKSGKERLILVSKIIRVLERQKS